jgi:FHS family L-fucose permease-like MFS transporter
MSIVGGSILPPLAASLFKINTNMALAIPLLCFSYIVYFAYSGSKIQTNE